MADDDLHVIKNGDDWTVTIEGQGDLVSFDTEEEAVRTARRIAETARCEAVIGLTRPHLARTDSLCG